MAGSIVQGRPGLTMVVYARNIAAAWCVMNALNGVATTAYWPGQVFGPTDRNIRKAISARKTARS